MKGKIEKKMKKEEEKNQKAKESLRQALMKANIKEVKKEVKQDNKKTKVNKKLNKLLEKENKRVNKIHEKHDKREKLKQLKEEKKGKLFKVKVRKGIFAERKFIIIPIILGVLFFLFLFIVYRKLLVSIIGALIIVGLFFIYIFLKDRLKESMRIKKIEANFPDFLQLMASNLRAGMTVDKSILLSSRPEFAPLDKEILTVGKDIATGKSTEAALIDMTKRIKSEKIEKTIFLIISGIRAVGNLAILLEETSRSMRARDFIEKKAASNVLMYVIFIFIAAAVGAPVLFALSSLLVETLTNTLANMPTVGTESYAAVPFTLSTVSISLAFVKVYAVFFIILTDILASLVLGLVSKGEEKEGLKYILPMILISMTLFFAIRFALGGFVGGLFG